MRRSIFRQIPILILLALGVLACASYAARPGTSARSSSTVITIEGFYEALAPYGSWVDVEIHGRVWRPSSVDADWRPYTHGQWVYTADGWTWLSDWSWGWAPFHYGRWSRHQRHGWIWVPGKIWAPAWVVWRDGDGWLGWAALPPSARWTVGVGLDLGTVDLMAAMAPDVWIFIPDRYFLDPRLHTRIIASSRSAALLRVTRDATRYAAKDYRVVGHSISVERVERTLGRAVPRYRLEDLRVPPAASAKTLERGKVRVYRPQVEQKPQRTPTSRKGRKSGGNPSG